MKFYLRYFSLLVGVLIVASTALAQTFVATVVAVSGDVKVLHLPLPGDHGPFLKVHNRTYIYHQAKLGAKIDPGEIIMSGTNGKVRLVYPNGDTFFVAYGSSFVLPVELNKQAKNNRHRANSLVKMYYGRFRALISKLGPRNRLRVVTPDAVAGVRGTDFFVRSNATVGTQLVVLRGAVAMRSKISSSHSILVKTGYLAQAKNKAITVPKVILVTREGLQKIRQESALKVNAREVAKLPKVEQKEIHELQKKAFESVMVDIHSHNPALYKELKRRKIKKLDQINNVVISRLWNHAPTAKNQKPALKMPKSNKHSYYRHPVVQ